MGHQAKVISLDKSNLNLLEDFLSDAGKSLDTFRYFESRGLESLKNHIVTYLLLKENKPVAYGHLDREDNKIWLGIAVAQKEIGKGFGKKLMTKLIKVAHEKEFREIYLSVDNDNYSAIALYNRFGFFEFEQGINTSYYKLAI